MGVWGAIKNIVKKVSNIAKDAFDYVKEKSSKAWNGVNGKSTFNEAEILLAEITDRYDKAKFDYDKNMKKFNKELEKRIDTINYHKTDIYEKYFKRFISLGNRLHNISIKGKSFLEYFDNSITEVKKLEGVRDKKELYLIDFNNLSFKEVGLGIITLGFFTRKKAKQTLIKIQEEESRINAEIEKMQSQLTKVKVILESIENVALYFDQLVLSYSKILDRFEYGISSQIQKIILRGGKLENGKLNFKLMPIVHIEEFSTLFNLSIVLKQMASMGYLNQDGEIEDNDIKAVNDIKFKIEQNEILAS
ncbi:hypothetical protein LXN10_01040 [Arcobacter sp. KX21116]|uniref:hypothetical protein n=1 Tax=Arcobacter iocasae TaxID=2906515 RepID=UPI0035D3F5E3